MNEKLYKFGVIYLGTLIMMISPYFINTQIGKVGMIIGLSLLTIQTQKTKQYNLSFLNVVAVFGYLFSLIQSL
jgi:hypothetical protein|tara:strand:- start:146 stop:364 length:219 start_codon:yes stop_codon:yes gene_type:complete